MKKIITLLFVLFVAGQLNAQAPDSWTEKNGLGLNAPVSALMAQRQEAVAFTINGKGYIGTGYTNVVSTSGLNDFWEYDPSTNVLTQKAAVPGSTRYAGAGFGIGNKGYIGLGFPNGNFYEYDVALNSWTQKAGFPGGSCYGSVSFSIGTKGYVGTGITTAGYTNSFWEYNPATNVWTAKAQVGNFSFPGRYRACGFSMGGKGYIGTGIDTSNTVYNDFYEYDPVTDNWTFKVNFAGGQRYGAVGFSVGTNGYIACGLGSSGLKNDLWQYNPANNSWSQKANFGGTARWLASAIGINNKGYIIGGKDANYKNDVWEYDTTANSWTLKSNTAATGRGYAAGFSIGNKGYIGTGAAVTGSSLNDFWEFNSNSGAWTQAANIGGAARTGAKGFSIEHKGYIVCGNSLGNDNNHLWEYNPANNTWTQKATCGGAGRINPVAFSIGNKGYMGTGRSYTGGNYKNDFWEYDPAVNVWTQRVNFGGAARSESIGFSIGNKGYIGTGYNGSPLNDFWEYNTVTDIWTQKANFTGAAIYGACGFSIGGKGYIDMQQGSVNNQLWEYDPVNNSWIQKTGFAGIGRYIATAFNIGSKGYLGTGAGSISPGVSFNDMWEYTPVCYTPVSAIYSSGNISFCSGDSVFLYANNGYNYQWKKNGVDITGATAYFYYAKTTGNYTCYLTNSCGAVTSSAISVTVNSLPSATITPAGSTTFCSGGSVVLNVPSGANKTYQWKKGANLISGATLSSYTATTGGNYRTIVTNTVTGCSKTTGSATTVTVNALPAATITPQGPTTFCAGGSVVLAANTGTGLTYQWKKGTNFISGATLSNYTAATGGNYRVQVTNNNGCSKTSGLVTVSVPCKEGESVTVGEGESVFGVNVYPNPNSGEFAFKFSAKPTSPIQIELTDELGKVVKRFETSDETVVIKKLNLSKGIYCLTARNKNETVIKKISVVK